MAYPHSYQLVFQEPTAADDVVVVRREERAGPSGCPLYENDTDVGLGRDRRARRRPHALGRRSSGPSLPVTARAGVGAGRNIRPGRRSATTGLRSGSDRPGRRRSRSGSSGPGDAELKAVRWPLPGDGVGRTFHGGRAAFMNEVARAPDDVGQSSAPISASSPGSGSGSAAASAL
ncbi:DUF6296 family protein [Streptomyces sp. NPDC014773]|uniref:DUF6296 family protein n=1 Tax=Streptomyces sp. NPDC014773 TaxID=3364908 RepID=UPI0036FF33C5